MRKDDDKQKPAETENSKEQNWLNEDVSANDDEIRSWDDNNQLDRGNDKENIDNEK